jgi:TPR repeat protein
MTTRDYFTLLKKAEKDDHEAQFHLGHQYYRLKQFKRAHSWWLKSAKQNKSLGPLFNIGNLYLNGWGVKQNIKKALYYFNLVISKKIIFLPEQKVKWSELALFLIGKTYFDGILVKRNKKKGLNYYRLAAKKGNLNAAYTLSQIYGTKENYDIKKKKYYLKQCANAGLSISHSQLAFLAFEENKHELFLMHFKMAMKNDKKIINTLELTTLARDALNKSLSEYRKNLKRIWKRSLKKSGLNEVR